MPDHGLRHVHDRLDVQPELHALHACVRLGVGLGRKVRIDAEGDRGLHAHLLRDFPESEKFGFAFDVEQEDAVLEAVLHLGVRLADAGEDDLCALAAGAEGSIKLAAGGDVEPAPMIGHQFADAQVRVRFHRIRDDRLRFRERGLDRLQMMEQRGLRIHVHRRAVFLGQFRNGDVFTEQGAVAVREMIHGDPWCQMGCRASDVSRWCLKSAFTPATRRRTLPWPGRSCKRSCPSRTSSIPDRRREDGRRCGDRSDP